MLGVRGWVRVGVRAAMAALAAVHLAWGGWALASPRGFFDTFPGGGRHWTAAYPPFNAHLVTDLGATFVTLGVLLAVAVVVADLKVTRVVLLGVIVFSALHLIYHAVHHGMLHGFDLAASLTTLVGGVLGPALIWLLTEVTRDRDS